MIQLYKHNKETYERVQNMFQDNNRVAVIQPTGSGKSFLILKFIEDRCNSKILVLSPSNEIFNQLKRYAQETGDCRILDNCTMYTYSKVINMDSDEIQDCKFDTIITDEFHRLGADLWGERTAQLFELNPDAKILGVTATPVRYLDNCRNMSEELFYNNVAREMTLGEAVVEGILPVPTYIPVYTDEIDQEFLDSNIPDNQKNKYYELFKHMENSYGVQTILKKYIPSGSGKFIVFCRDAAHLKTMQTTLVRWFRECKIKTCKYVSVCMMSDKDEQLNEFIEDNSECVKLLFTIDRLNEGLHVPNIDGVIMLRQTESPTIYLQQIGRALSSKHKDKSPLVFDFVNNYANVTIREAGEKDINVFESEIRSIIKNKKDLDNSIFEVFEHALEFIEIQQQIDSLLSLGTNWISMFELYKEFKQEFDREPKQEEVYKDIMIGRWITKQRSNYNQNKLSQERIKLLEDEGFIFKIVDLELQWNSMFELYKEFKQEFDREPKSIEVYKDMNLGNWVFGRRQDYKKGVLSQERIKMLEEVGFVFDNINELQWNSNFELYKEFKQEFDREPKRNEFYKNINIGTWEREQRRSYKESKLSSEKIKMLEEAGFVFDNKLELQWNSMFELYKEFKQEFGREPKQKEVYKDRKIGNWLSDRKRNYKQGKLSEERIKLLEDAGFKF